MSSIGISPISVRTIDPASKQSPREPVMLVKAIASLKPVAEFSNFNLLF